MLLTSILTLSIPIAALAGNPHEGMNRRHRETAHRVVGRGSSRKFKLVDMYKGDTFLKGWDFFSGKDPTNGAVNYQTRENAIKKGLAYVQEEDGAVVLAVDDKTWLANGAFRDSVRISTKKTYDEGLFISDFTKMPHGCSVWPAYWSLGQSAPWPDAGEIDILEGVNNMPANQFTLHTGPDCTLHDTSKDRSIAPAFTGRVVNTKCHVGGGDNAGCAIVDGDTRSYGAPFNNATGGVYAHLWDKSGIKMWFFSRAEIPANMETNPDPSSWGTPNAFFSSASCDMEKSFSQHALIIDTTLCGDWAGATFKQDGCAGKCIDTVADPTNFKLAKWNINYIAVWK